MTQHFGGDLFAVPEQRTLAPLPARREEANARIVRAKNAALQRPLSYLDVSRNQFTNDDVKLFEEINPIQIAQYFLEKVSDSMIFGYVTTTSDMKKIVQEYVASLDFRNTLSEEQHIRIVSKVIGALRNEQNQHGVFREVIRNEVTGEEIEYKFALVTVHSTLVTGREDHVYKLTQEGVKLLHLNWQAPDDFDMFSVMIEAAINSGKYSEAANHIDACRRSSARIEAVLGEIELKLNQQSYEKDFEEELRGLIADVQAEADSFGQISTRQSNFIRMSNEADELDEETRRALDEIANKIRELQRIHARFSTTIGKVLGSFVRFQARRIADLGSEYHVPDITGQYLQRMAVLPKQAMIEQGLADAVIATLLPAKRPSIFDPFVLFDTARLGDEDRSDEPDDTQETVEIPKSTRTSVAEMNTATNFIKSILKRFGKDGIRLSKVFEILDAQKDFKREMKFIIAHRTAFVSQKFAGWHIAKRDDGKRLAGCPYLSGPDLILKVEQP